MGNKNKQVKKIKKVMGEDYFSTEFAMWHIANVAKRNQTIAQIQNRKKPWYSGMTALQFIQHINSGVFQQEMNKRLKQEVIRRVFTKS